MAMKSLFLLFFLVLPIVSKRHKEDEEDLDEWHCGSDKFSRKVSRTQIKKGCPELKELVNDCCAKHDSCYDKQIGRTFCDNTFCQCLEVATNTSQHCSENESPLFCSTVRWMGGVAYEEARKRNKFTTVEEEVEEEPHQEPLTHIPAHEKESKEDHMIREDSENILESAEKVLEQAAGSG